MRTKNKNFPAIHVASERSSESRYRKIKELFDRLQKPNRFTKGQFVKWKSGLRNKAFPHYGEPAIVMTILDEAIFDPSENSAASPYFRESLTIIIGVCVLTLPALQRALGADLGRRLGRVSFSLYLVHFPVLVTLTTALVVWLRPFGHGFAIALASAAGLIVTAALTLVFERLVDRPTQEFSRRIRIFGRYGATGMIGSIDRRPTEPGEIEAANLPPRPNA
jgi:Acyltransferase family